MASLPKKTKDYEVDDNSLGNFIRQMPIKLSWIPPTYSNQLWTFWPEDSVKEDDNESKNSKSSFDSLTKDSEIKEKITYVLRRLLYDDNFCILLQFWAPRTIKCKHFLTTSDQPFGLNNFHQGLCAYRNHSLDYKFVVSEEEEEGIGPIGRVFRHKLPELTPDVRYHSSREYPQRDFAVDCSVRGLLALPVFEPSVSGQHCIGVLELVTTSDCGVHVLDIKHVFNTLKVVGLKCTDLYCYSDVPNQICQGLGDALDEIEMVLQVSCKTYHLPFAQTWIPCRHSDAVAYDGSPGKSWTGFGVGSMEEVISTTARGWYASDVLLSDVRTACGVQWIQKGKGVVGRAFLSYKPFFCRDITEFSITEYPSVYFARKIGSMGCFAICLRSNYTGNYAYILEFFLPPRKMIGGDPLTLLDSLLGTMEQHFQSFKIASGEEIGEELSVAVIKSSSHHEVNSFQICQTARSPSKLEALRHVGGAVQLDSSFQEFTEKVDTTNDGKNVVRLEYRDIAVTHSERR